MHDLSKFSPTEFFESAKYYKGFRSPIGVCRREKGVSLAWLHHKGRNKHHFEYWNDINIETKRYESVPMPLRFVKEMFCDRVAASKIYRGKDYDDGHPLRYFRGGPDKSEMHPETAALLEGWLRTLAEKGEREAFAAVKAAVKKKEY